MNEYIAALRRDYPAIDELLRQYGDFSIAEYLQKIGHRQLPEILPSEDLLTAVRNYLNPFFGEETARRAAALLGRLRCLSTSNHHHLAFSCCFVQDTLLYEQWLRKNGETEGIVPIFAASNVNLQTSSYPRGMILYDCTLPDKMLKLPLFPYKMKHCCTGGIGKISPAMIRRAQEQLLKLKRNGTIRPSMFHAVSDFCENILLSDSAQNCSSCRDQATAVNALVSQRYFADRSPRYLWMPMEDIVSELLQKDLRQEGSLLYCLLFQPALRKSLMTRLDGVSGCWTGTSAGTHFFWGLDSRGVLFSMHLKIEQNRTLLTGTDSAGSTVTIPFDAKTICDHLKHRTLFPSLLLDFLELYFLRNYTVFGGYYQPAYLKHMQEGIVGSLEALNIFHEEAEIIRQKTSYTTLGPTYLIRDRGDGPYRVSTAELLEEPVPTQELEERLEMSLTDSYVMMLP